METNPMSFPVAPISIIARETSFQFPAEPPRTREWTHDKSPSSVSSIESKQRLLPGHSHSEIAGSFNSVVNLLETPGQKGLSPTPQRNGSPAVRTSPSDNHRLSIVDMYSGSDGLPREGFDQSIHPPLTMYTRYGGAVAPRSRLEEGRAINPLNEGDRRLPRVPSMPSSVTNSTSSLTWASVWTSSRS
jgi:hypothetical protein